MLEDILSAENMRAAYQRVVSNKGAAGIDGMGVDELHAHLCENWAGIRDQLRQGTYIPSAVRKVEIPKPNGGKRMLGIPTVTDRLIQQAIARKLSVMYDGNFSDSSFGFRPQHSAHQAVERALYYLNNGSNKVVELDLEKFFDRVNHDKLMSVLYERVSDKILLKLIRRYLQAGIMEGGVASPRTEGTPQGSPLSPVLSNILLDKLDKELERRKLRFVRYADDCSIYVSSTRSAERVLQSITTYLEEKLLLKVNREKSKVSRPKESQLLGFSFWCMAKGKWAACVAPKPKVRLKEKIRRITKRNRGVSVRQITEELRMATYGWINYFRVANCHKFLRRMDERIRNRLRAYIWKQWQFIRTRKKKLRKFGVPEWSLHKIANTRKGPTRMALILNTVLTDKYLRNMGFAPMLEYYEKNTTCLMNRRVPNGTHGGVRGRNGK